MITFKILLTTGLKQSTNKIYAGIHWTKRKELKNGFLGNVARVCKKLEPIECYPVQISYRFVFETKALDTLNCAYMAKCIEDALCSTRVLKDDDPAHVTRSIIEVVKKPRPDVPGETPADRKIRKAIKKEDIVEVEITKITT